MAPLIRDWPNGPQNTAIGCSPPPENGSHEVVLDATNYGGWWLDLEGLVGLEEDWTFSVDVLRHPSSDPGWNDVGIRRVGVGNGSQLTLGLAESTDGSYHHLRMVMDHVADEVHQYVDGVYVGSVEPHDNPDAVILSSNAIAFLFGNDAVSVSVHFDNVSFAVGAAAVSAPEPDVRQPWSAIKARYR